jgi:hypothetical protein
VLKGKRHPWEESRLPSPLRRAEAELHNRWGRDPLACTS